MKVLITGGAGFIGRRLVKRLLEAGREVVVLDDLSSGDVSQLDKRVEFVQASVLDKSALRGAIVSVSQIYHLAAIASVEKCNEDLVASHTVNVTGFVNILEEISKLEVRPSLVYASSAAIYGRNNAVPLTEKAEAAPLSPYGADKFSCELHARSGYEVFGISSTGLRFFNVYGPGQDASSPYSGVISKFVERALSGEEIIIHGDGLQTRDFVFVEDVVTALVRSAEQREGCARIYNVCTGREISVLELAETLVATIGSKSGISHSEGRLGDIRRSFGSSQAFQRDLGIAELVPLAGGLTALLDHLAGERAEEVII